MSIIEWEEPTLVPEYSIPDDIGEEIVVMRLRVEGTDNRWQGRLHLWTGKKKTPYAAEYCRIELRKSFKGAAVVIRVGAVEEHTNSFSNIPRERDVALSASGKMHMTMTEMEEMRLAIREARLALDAHIATLQNKD